MSVFSNWRDKLALNNLFDIFGGDESPENIGIYGPPNSGKTTLTNRIIKESSEYNYDEEQEDQEGSEGEEFEEVDEQLGSASEVPHETRKAEKRENITIEADGESITLNIVDTPGVTTSVDYEDFTDFDLEKEESIDRAREATEGIAEAMHWLKGDVDGVIYMMDSTKDPFTQVNTMLLGIIESQDIPTVILANKTDLEDSNVDRIRNAFPQHDVVPVSALTGENMDEVYESISENFG